MADVIIFGLQDTAQLAHYYLTNDSEHRVVAFTVHGQYMDSTEDAKNKLGIDLPVYPFEAIVDYFSPKSYKLFVPMTGAGMNKKREAVYLQGKEKGYEYISYVSSKATKFNNKIGENCFILEDNTIQPFVEIGNNVVMWSGNHCGHGSFFYDHTFLTSHVVVSGHCHIKKYCWLGVNSTIRNGLTLEEGTLLGMGSCLTKNSFSWSTYVGIPAKVNGKHSMEANP